MSNFVGSPTFHFNTSNFYSNFHAYATNGWLGITSTYVTQNGLESKLAGGNITIGTGVYSGYTRWFLKDQSTGENVILRKGAIYIYKSGDIGSEELPVSINGYASKTIPLTFTDENIWEFEGYIFKGSGSSGRQYFPIFREKTQTQVWYENFVQTNPNKMTFKPYEPLNLTGISVTCDRRQGLVDSDGFPGSPQTQPLSYPTFTSVISNSSSNNYPNNGYYHEGYIGSPYGTPFAVTLNGKGLSWLLTVTDWDSKVHGVEKHPSNPTYKIYSGQTVGNDFLIAYRAYYEVSNEFKTIKTITNNALTLENMSKTIISESDSALIFDYYVSGTGQTVTGITITENIHKLKAGNDKFANVLYTKGYSLNTIIASFDPKTKGSLTYDDNTTVSLSAIAYNTDPTVTTSIGKLPITLTEEYSGVEFTMTYTLPTTHFGTFVLTFDCDVSESTEVYSVSLKNAKTHFLFGEIVDYGSSLLETKIERFNIHGTKLDEVLYSEFSSHFNNKDERYGKTIGGEKVPLTTNELTLLSNFDTFSITHKIKMSYAALLVVNSAAISKYVYIDNSFTTFDDLNLATASVTYYNNSGAALITETKDVTGVLQLTHITPNFDLNTQVITVAASAVYEGRTVTLPNAFQITCELIRPTQIVATGSGGTTQYFDNNSDKFKIPTDLSFTLYYNDHTPESPHYELVNPTNDLTFYRDSGFTQVITTDTVLHSKDGSAIYFKHKYHDLSGSYMITFVPDNIISAELTTPISFILGNRLNTLRNVFDIKVTYTSGIQKTGFESYSFKQTTVILTDTAPIIVISGNEYTLNINDITFVKPSIDEIEVNTTRLNTSYSNDTDTIDVASNVTVITKYAGAEFVQECTYDQASLSANGKYTIENSDVSNGFAFDGSDVVSIDMEGEVEKTLELEITVLNYFDNGDTTNNTTSIFINVLEITDITGISLCKLMNTYSVGDTFLDSEIDDTEVYIYYNKKEIVNNEETIIQKKKKIKLASGFSAINIFPIKGTKFIRTNEALTVRITAATNERASLQYTVSVNPRHISSSDVTKRLLRVVFASNYTYQTSEKVNFTITNKHVIVDDENTSVLNGERVLNDGLPLQDVKVYGYLDNVNDKTSNGRVVFFEDYMPPVIGQSNIKVTFPCFVPGQADYINKCTIGQLFGNNNSKNRLFLSGNPDLPNCDWHSGGINTNKIEGDFSDENGDFTYFDDLSYCFYGQTDNKIVGYDIVTNDKMVVLKSKSDKEPTIYYRTSGLVQALDASGNALTDFSGRTLYEESYPLVVGNIGVGALSNKAMLNFNGDTLFLSSDNQLDGLDVEGILGDAQRYAYSRSYYVNPLLKTIDLRKAWLYTNNKYLYLVTKDFILVSHFEAFNEEDRQYEWWKINVADVSAFIELDNEMFFGTTKGKFVRFETKGFQDITKIFLPEGAAVPLVLGQQFDDEIQVSDTIVNQLVNGDDFYFKIVSKDSDYNSHMYNQIAVINNVKSGTFDLYIDKTLNAFEVCGFIDSVLDNDKYESLVKQLSTERIYYLNRREEENEIVDTNPNSPLKVYGKPYRLKMVDGFHMGKGLLFKLVDAETNEELNLQTLSRGALVERMTDIYTIVDIDYDTARFKLRDNRGQVLDIVRYAAQSMTKNFKAEISKFRNVRAYYITSPHTMGDLMHNKTIWGWTITNDTQIKSSIEICQATNDTHLEEMETIVDFNRSDYGLNLENFNVANINFDKYTIPHKYTFYRPLNVPFISFGFRNNSGDNAVLSSMQIIYTIPFPSIGNN